MTRKEFHLAARLACIALIWPHPVSAQPQEQGAGARTCKDFLRRAGPTGLSDKAANQWVMGYLTGRTEAKPNAPHRKFTGPEGIMADVVSFCHAAQSIKDADLDLAAASFFVAPPRKSH